jgi:outer membrane protein TolC
MRHFTQFLAVFGWIALGSTLSQAEPWTLERAIEQALAHNPDARLAQHRIAAAQAGVEQANSAFWPRLQFQSSYTRTDNPMMAFGSILNQKAFSPALSFNDVPDVDNLNARGVVTMPLYAGGRNKAGRLAARASTEAAKQDVEAIRNALGFEVARTFHTVLKTREFIRAAEAAVSSVETNVNVAKRRFEGGTLLKTEVLDLEVRLAEAREDLVRARNANALASRTLRNLLGIEEDSLRWLTAPPARVFLLPLIFPDAPNSPPRGSANRPRRKRPGAPRLVTCRASARLAVWITIMAGSTKMVAAAIPPAACSSGISGTAS